MHKHSHFGISFIFINILAHPSILTTLRKLNLKLICSIKSDVKNMFRSTPTNPIPQFLINQSFSLYSIYSIVHRLACLVFSLKVCFHENQSHTCLYLELLPTPLLALKSVLNHPQRPSIELE